MQRSINVSSPSPKKKKAKSRFHSYQMAGRTGIHHKQELRKNQQNFNQANGHMWTAIWIRIPRRLSHRVGLYHQQLFPVDHHRIQARLHQKLGMGQDTYERSALTLMGPFPRIGQGSERRKMRRISLRHFTPLPRAL